ncbi:MAG: hypothetical protein Q4C31_00810 [Eubacteriales bacterium]|nr:hypothetical protein [Eubacteriales bacterium]
MKKWYDEEYRFGIQVVGYLRGEKPQGYCRNGEKIGDTYGCPDGCVIFRLSATPTGNENFFRGEFVQQ